MMDKIRKDNAKETELKQDKYLESLESMALGEDLLLHQVVQSQGAKMKEKRNETGKKVKPVQGTKND